MSASKSLRPLSMAMIALLALGVAAVVALASYDLAISETSSSYRLTEAVLSDEGGGTRPEPLPAWGDCRDCELTVLLSVDRPVEAVMVAFVSDNAIVRVNGQRLPHYGRIGSPVSDMSYTPLLWRLPERLEGTPDAPVALEITVLRNGGEPFIASVYAGPADTLGALASWLRFVSLTLPVIGIALTAVGGLLALAVAPLFKQRALLWASAAFMLSWSFATAYTVFIWGVLDRVWAGPGYFLSVGLFLSTSVFFAFEWTSQNTDRRFWIAIKTLRRWVYAVFSVLGAFPLIYFVLLVDYRDRPAFFTLVNEYAQIIGVIAIFTSLVFMVSYYARAKLHQLPEAAIILFILFAAILDIILIALFDLHGVLMSAASLIFPLMLVLSLAVRAGEVFNAAALNSAELAERVRLREADIKVALRERHEKAAALQRAEERMAVVREVHDTTGARLLSLLLSARRGTLDQPDLVRSLQSGLDEMRLLIHSLEASHIGLTQPIAVLRQQVDRAASAISMDVNWTVEIEEASPAPAAWVLNVCRIVQQAAMNAIQHSGGDRLDIQIGLADGQIAIKIADNGQGFSQAILDGSPRAGRGIAFMRSRARELGAELVLTNAEPGSAVTLTAPVPEPA